MLFRHRWMGAENDSIITLCISLGAFHPQMGSTHVGQGWPPAAISVHRLHVLKCSFSLLRYGEARQSGDDCYCKDNVLQFPRGGAPQALQGHKGRHQSRSEAEWTGGECGPQPLLWVLWEEMGQQGEQVKNWLVCIISASSRA